MTDGCPELIGAVETDRVAVSTASLLAGLPQEEQALVVAGGDRAITTKVRQLRAGSTPASHSAGTTPSRASKPAASATRQATMY